MFRLVWWQGGKVIEVTEHAVHENAVAVLNATWMRVSDTEITAHLLDADGRLLLEKQSGEHATDCHRVTKFAPVRRSYV